MSKKLFILIVIFLLLGCDQEKQIFNQDKKPRIISLAPAVTEILFKLGLENQIVGVTTYCDYPFETQRIEKVGTFSNPNIEKIISLNPDIIFATGLEQALCVEKLRNLNLNIYVSDPSNIKELFDSIKEIGKITNKLKQAEGLIEKMKAKINLIKGKVKSIPLSKRPKVFVQIWPHPLITIGRKSFIDELITLAGGINITHDIPRAYSYVNLELVVKRNPDCIILAYMGQDKDSEYFKNSIGYRRINAIKNNQVFDDINPDLFLRPGPRIIQGLEEIFKRVHNSS